MKSLASLFAATTFALTPQVYAQNLDDVVRTSVLTGWDADGTRVAAIEIKLASGWKTYWRAPGDAGIPPRFDWSASRNLRGVDVKWPTPDVFWQSGMRSIGYDNTLILPLTVLPKRSGDEIRLRGSVEIGVCADICIPYSFDVDAVLPSGANKRDPRIAAAIADVPLSSKEAGVGAVACSVSPTEDGIRLSATIDMPSAGGAEVSVIEAGDPQVWVSEPSTKRSGGQVTATADMVHVTGNAFALNRSDVTITVLGSKHAVEVIGCSGG